MQWSRGGGEDGCWGACQARDHCSRQRFSTFIKGTTVGFKQDIRTHFSAMLVATKPDIETCRDGVSLCSPWLSSELTDEFAECQKRAAVNTWPHSSRVVSIAALKNNIVYLLSKVMGAEACFSWNHIVHLYSFTLNFCTHYRHRWAGYSKPSSLGVRINASSLCITVSSQWFTPENLPNRERVMHVLDSQHMLLISTCCYRQLHSCSFSYLLYSWHFIVMQKWYIIPWIILSTAAVTQRPRGDLIASSNFRIDESNITFYGF